MNKKQQWQPRVSGKNASKEPSPKQKQWWKDNAGKEFPAGTTRSQASTLIGQWINTNGKPAPKPKAGIPKGAAGPAAKKRPARKAGIPSWPPKQDPMPKECEPFKHLVPVASDKDIVNFVIRKGMFDKAKQAADARRPALYNGEAGTGKTTVPKALAFIRRVPFLLISADSRMYSRELLGQICIRNGTSLFQEGLFLMLTQVPSHIHVSEFNTMDTGSAMFWQSINNERTCYVKEADSGKGKVYHLHKDCVITFDANPPCARYNGVQRYNVAQLDRLQVINFLPWTYDEVKAVLDKQNLPDSSGLAGFYVDAVALIMKAGYRCMVSIRGVKRVAELIASGDSPKEAFNMGVLDPKERATNTGLEMAVGGGVSAIAIWFGSRMLDGGDFTTPFFIMASGIAISSIIYWRVFRPLEISELANGTFEPDPEPPESQPALAD